MKSTNIELKMSALKNIENVKFVVVDHDGNLSFLIDGFFGNQEFTYDIHTTILKDELFAIPLNSYTNFIDSILGSSTLTFSDGPSCVDILIFECMQYLPGQFLLKMFFRAEDELVGDISLDFNLNV